jgi:hypothetical protein
MAGEIFRVDRADAAGAELAETYHPCVLFGLRKLAPLHGVY